MTAEEDFEGAVDASHNALDRIAKGDPSAFFELYSQREDVTLANPFGPPARGRQEVEAAGGRAAANYRGGRAIGFDRYARCVEGEMGYVLEIERFEAKVGASDTITRVALRTTSIFRRENGAWKLVHRHADPITTARPAESVAQA